MRTENRQVSFLRYPLLDKHSWEVGRGRGRGE